MAKQDIQTIIGSSISKDETLLKNFKSIKSCFVGWVESYNATSGTVNVQPAIQDYIPNDEQSGNNYRNSPLLVNVWVFGTFKSTAIEKGDKAVCFVLDQKANDFFKCIYDSSLSLGFQTFKPKTSAQKSVCDCVCVILGDASFQEVYEAISAIDTSLENKADIDGTYPDMTVGKATADGDGNNIPNTYAKQTGTYPDMTVGNATNAQTAASATNAQTATNATNVTENINGTPITDIFESDGTTVKKATQATEDGNGNVISTTYATVTALGNETSARLSADTTLQNNINDIVNGTTPAGDSDKLGGVDAASYAKLTQVVRTDTAQTFTDAQKLQAQKNLGIIVSDHKSVGVETQGWHNLLEISTYAKGTCFISQRYNYKQPFVAAFDFSIAVGYSYNITITAAGQGTTNSGIYKLRFAQINGRYYIQLYFPHTQVETFQVAAYIDSDVYPCIVLDNTVTDVDSQNAAAEIEVKNGINTSGGVYQNGAPVLAIDPTKLVPSTANGWSGGTSSSIPSTAGAYWVKVDNQPITLIAYYVGGDWVSGTTIWYKQA